MDARSEANLTLVHTDLVRIVRLCPAKFIVIEGLRTPAEEARMVAKGKSQTMHSRHLPNAAGVACAVDLLALDEHGAGTWLSPYYTALAAAMKATAAQLSLPLEWGGDWTTLKDMDHFQLPWATYP